ncbi:MAG: CinA family protein [Ruminococcus sp.]|nr:CinA family protein [Ruminococcus sp.]
MIEITASEFYRQLKNENLNENELQALVVKKLIPINKKVSTAESCTGGLVSKRITEVSGSSSVFECGICSYANRIKNKILGVDNETLNTVGAVSPETAAQMAEGVRELADADYGVSTTGIAGPTGGTKDKPVGLVYFAVSSEKETLIIKGLLGDAKDKSREGIRKTASSVILYYLLKQIR